MLMKRSDDAAAFVNAELDTPVDRPGSHGITDPAAAERTPGCCVMTRERDAVGFPKHHGILVTYAPELVVVRSHGWRNEERCVWTGTAEQYHQDWECD